MPAYTVKEISGPRKWEWPRDSGQFNHDYTLDIEGQAQQAILTQKAQTPPPAPGEMELVLEPHPRFADKLKASKPRPVNFSGGPRPRDPKESAAIVRQHSQSTALAAIELCATFGALSEQPKNEQEFLKLVGRFADWLDKDVARAREAA